MFHKIFIFSYQLVSVFFLSFPFLLFFTIYFWGKDEIDIGYLFFGVIDIVILVDS